MNPARIYDEQAWVAPSSRTTGTLITAAIWNQDVVDNPTALKASITALEESVNFLMAEVLR